jgi:hypothetical protein
MSYMRSARLGGLAVLLLVGGSALAQSDAARDDEQPPLGEKPAKPAPARPAPKAEPGKSAPGTEAAPGDEPAAAAGKPAGPAAPTEAKPEPARVATVAGPQKPRLTAYAYEEGNGTGAVAAADAIEAAVAESLRGDGRVTLSTTGELLDPPLEADRALGRADLAIVDAESAFAAMELEQAKQLLNDGVAAYNKHLPRLGQRGGGTEPLRDAWLKLAKTQFFDGNPEASREAMRYALVLDPTITWAKTQFPPTMKKLVVEAKLLFETLGPGKLSIDSDPPGATVFLNGKRLDAVTPTEVPDAQPGPNYVSFERRGYQTVTATVENKGEGQTSTVVQGLPRWPKNPFGTLDRARKELDQSDTPPHLKESAQTLGVEMLLLVRAQPDAEEGKRRVVAYLYDSRPDRVLKRASAVVPEADVPQAARSLASEAMTGVRFDGIWKLPETPRKPSWWARFSNKTKQDFTKFYHWKYFWYVVGGVAGAVVVSTAVGVGVAEHNRQVANQAVILFGGN